MQLASVINVSHSHTPGKKAFKRDAFFSLCLFFQYSSRENCCHTKKWTIRSTATKKKCKKRRKKDFKKRNGVACVHSFKICLVETLNRMKTEKMLIFILLRWALGCCCCFYIRLCCACFAFYVGCLQRPCSSTWVGEVSEQASERTAMYHRNLRSKCINV